jgi:RNA polymerase sigma factor (sigma-70 family)
MPQDHRTPVAPRPRPATERVDEGRTDPSGSGASDADLVARACEGDASAFETLMRRHNRLLFRTARGIAGDDAEAEDVVQQTYLHAFSRLASYRGDSALGTWLARIAINAALDSQRKRGRIVDLHAGDPDDETATENTMSLRTDENESPDGALERGEVRRLLQAAIEDLPPIYRSVFLLRAVEELSVDEAAFALRVSDSVVKTRYLRARALLREALGSHIEAQAPQAFTFAGARCDAVVAHVLAELERDGRIRRH